MAKHPLKRFSERASLDPFFLGATLASIQEARDWDEKTLAAFLSCDLIGLYRLASCRAPSLHPAQFALDIRAISTFVSCDPDRLAEVVREGAVSTALRGGPTDASNTYLLAARDHKVKPSGNRSKHDRRTDGP